MSSANEGTNGFLCEFNDKIVKIYTLDSGLVELPNPTNEELVLGNWYWILDDVIESQDYVKNDEIKTWTANGEVFVQVCAITPNEFVLPKAIRDKYSLMVWSPFLNFLNDDNDIFIDNFRGGDVGEIVVKYAPFEDKLFEVIKVVGMGKPTSQAYVKLTPWTLEYMAENMNEIAAPKPGLPIVDQTKSTFVGDVQMGICIKTDYSNPKYSTLNKGSTQFCRLLFSPSWGLTRWTIPEKNKMEGSQQWGQQKEVDTSTLGVWHSYSLHDVRKNKTSRGSSSSSLFLSATACKMREVSAPKPTRIVNGEVEIETSFKFIHDMLENKQNRSIQHWNNRKVGLSQDAHFGDLDLGRVEIYPRHSQFIIQKIEEHRKKLRKNEPKEYERLKNETIIVVVQVMVHKNFYENFLNYPKQGVFTIKTVDTICYLQGGKIIWKAAK